MQDKKPKVKHQPTKKSSKISPLTCELELSANLANALALDKSIRRRKNGNASLKKKKKKKGHMLKFKVYGTGKKKSKREIQNNNSLLTSNL